MMVKDKIAIVTGASGEIGSVTVKCLLSNGAHVVGQYRKNTKKINELETYAKSMDRELLMTMVDFSKPVSAEKDVKTMVQATLEKFGKIDILINLAGVTENKLWDRSVIEYSVEDLLHIMNVDVFGTFLCCKYVASHMKKQKHGVIVIMSGNSAIVGGGYGLGWIVAKSANLGLAKAFAHGLAPDVRVNAIAPGYINTEWVKHISSPSELKEAARTSLLRRMGRPEEVAQLILYLCSDASSYITGQTILIDGGTVIR
jgi:NAD(P)-dependent dehydrogenase (short-subunit alcohol dehydrogenase family)